MTTEDIYTARLVDARVPPHLHHGLLMYLLHHIQPGHFLTAVLENNLSEAMVRADEESRSGLFQIMVFLYNDVPSPCWGSPKKVASWLAARSEVTS